MTKKEKQYIDELALFEKKLASFLQDSRVYPVGWYIFFSCDPAAYPLVKTAIFWAWEPLVRKVLSAGSYAMSSFTTLVNPKTIKS